MFTDRERQEFIKIAQEMERQKQIPNYLTIQEFLPFVEIYRKHPEFEHGDPAKIKHEKHIVELTKKFSQKIDFYKETHILKSKDNKDDVLLILPAIFIPMQSLGFSEENDQLVRRNRSDSASPFAKIAVESQIKMMEAFAKEQTTPQNIEQLAQIKMRTKTVLDQFHDLKHGVKSTQSDTLSAPTGSAKIDLSNVYTEIEDE